MTGSHVRAFQGVGDEQLDDRRVNAQANSAIRFSSLRSPFLQTDLAPHRRKQMTVGEYSITKSVVPLFVGRRGRVLAKALLPTLEPCQGRALLARCLSGKFPAMPE
jgi:hypothetical protein